MDHGWMVGSTWNESFNWRSLLDEFELGYRMINFVIQSHNKSTLTGGGNRRIPTDRFQFPAFHATASPVSHSLCAAHRSFNALLVRALCFGEDDWGFSPFFKLPLGYFHRRPSSSSSSSSSPFCCISSLSLHAFHAFFYYGLLGGGGIAFLGFSALWLGLQQPSPSVPLLYRLDLFSLRTVVSCVHFGSRLSGGGFFFFSFLSCSGRRSKRLKFSVAVSLPCNCLVFFWSTVL